MFNAIGNLSVTLMEFWKTYTNLDVINNINIVRGLIKKRKWRKQQRRRIIGEGFEHLQAENIVELLNADEKTLSVEE